ncbi:host cell division inhibitor Icd-like protein [Providencia sp. PROV200]|uniref:host cell division inhibitor Icd-like protein n=1 Tax=Providencia sp. PROV200 TaxID=2936794 RepID=UPI003CED4491
MMNIATNAYQMNDSLLAGDESLTKNLVNQSAKLYANQSILTTVGGWDNSDNLKHGEFTPFDKGEFSHLCKNFDDNHFTFLLTFGYSKNALTKSSVRICTLNQLTATHDAPSVFFCVYAYAHLLNAVLYRPNSMVMLAGQPQGWLGSVNSSSANPVSVTTPIEICTSSGDSLTKLTEIIVMMATPTQTQFKFLFLAVKRTDKTDTPHRIEATAPNEHDARLMLVRDYILSFAGRLPAQEVTA